MAKVENKEVEKNEEEVSDEKNVEAKPNNEKTIKIIGTIIEIYVKNKSNSIEDCRKFVCELSTMMKKYKRRIVQRKLYDKTEAKSAKKNRYKNKKKYIKCETCNKTILSSSLAYHNESKKHKMIKNNE